MRVLVHYHDALPRTEHRLILYHHALNFERFWDVSMHLISHSKSAPRTRLVDAQHLMSRVR